MQNSLNANLYSSLSNNFHSSKNNMMSINNNAGVTIDGNFKFMPVVEINILEEDSQSTPPQDSFANLNFSRRLTEDMKLHKKFSDRIDTKHRTL